MSESAPIPDYAKFKLTSDFRFLTMYAHQRSNHLLGLDNLLDLSHAGFLHRASIGRGTDAIQRKFENAHYKAWRDSGTIFSRWEFLDAQGNASEHDWVETAWDPPGRIVLTKGFDRSLPPKPGIQRGLHFHTPETESSSHYFSVEIYDSSKVSTDFEERTTKFLTEEVFKFEDDEIMVGIAENMGDKDLLDLHPTLLSIDHGAVLARRLYKERLEEEKA